MGSMGLFPYFTEIIGKNIAWDFGSWISSKISASASKISACCGPLVHTEEFYAHLILLSYKNTSQFLLFSASLMSCQIITH